jgi:hypothetical protein
MSINGEWLRNVMALPQERLLRRTPAIRVCAQADTRGVRSRDAGAYVLFRTSRFARRTIATQVLFTRFPFTGKRIASAKIRATGTFRPPIVMISLSLRKGGGR